MAISRNVLSKLASCDLRGRTYCSVFQKLECGLHICTLINGMLGELLDTLLLGIDSYAIYSTIIYCLVNILRAI